MTNMFCKSNKIIRCLLLSLYFIGGLCIHAQSAADIEAYIDRYRDIALRHEIEYGIPASITLAQGILESGAGKSALACKANNHFGVKASRGWSGPVYYAKDDEIGLSQFRVYTSPEESYRDHAKVLVTGSRYRSLFDKSVYDYRSWANGLQSAGYATSPVYAKALIGYVEAYNLFAINGGVKLKKGKTTVITKTITIEELEDLDDVVSDENEVSEEEEIVKSVVRKFVIDINDVRCAILYPGETLTSVALKYDIPKEKLLEYNETTSENDIREGDIIFIEKKKKKYNGPQDYYFVRSGDTLYKISQQFGIRLDNLLKMNDMSILTNIREGQRIKLK